MYSVPCAAATVFVLFLPVSTGRWVAPSARRAERERTLKFTLPAPRALLSVKLSFVPPTRFMNFLFPAVSEISPLTVAPFGSTVTPFTLKSSGSVNFSGTPKSTLEGMSAVRTIRNGIASGTVTGTVCGVAAGAGVGGGGGAVAALVGVGSAAAGVAAGEADGAGVTAGLVGAGDGAGAAS